MDQQASSTTPVGLAISAAVPRHIVSEEGHTVDHDQLPSTPHHSARNSPARGPRQTPDNEPMVNGFSDHTSQPSSHESEASQELDALLRYHNDSIESTWDRLTFDRNFLELRRLRGDAELREKARAGAQLGRCQNNNDLRALRSQLGFYWVENVAVAADEIDGFLLQETRIVLDFQYNQIVSRMIAYAQAQRHTEELMTLLRRRISEQIDELAREASGSEPDSEEEFEEDGLDAAAEERYPLAVRQPSPSSARPPSA